MLALALMALAASNVEWAQFGHHHWGVSGGVHHHHPHMGSHHHGDGGHRHHVPAEAPSESDEPADTQGVYIASFAFLDVELGSTPAQVDPVRSMARVVAKAEGQLAQDQPRHPAAPRGPPAV